MSGMKEEEEKEEKMAHRILIMLWSFLSFNPDAQKHYIIFLMRFKFALIKKNFTNHLSDLYFLLSRHRKGTSHVEVGIQANWPFSWSFSRFL